MVNVNTPFGKMKMNQKVFYDVFPDVINAEGIIKKNGILAIGNSAKKFKKENIATFARWKYGITDIKKRWNK